MYFVLLIGFLNLMRWALCAANCAMSRWSSRLDVREHRFQAGWQFAMRLNTTSGFTWGNGLRVMGLILALAFSFGGQDRVHITNRTLHHGEARTNFFSAGTHTSAASNERSEIRNYLMDLAGDHSLDDATVIEQEFQGYAKYTVQLHLASGAEQSIVLTAPPGGLQIEMHDMTGDKVPNDLLVRPAHQQWLPTILVNDGHDHFTVVIPGATETYISSTQELAPSESDHHGTVALSSSSFKAHALANPGESFVPQNKIETRVPTDELSVISLGHDFSSGRAPPSLPFSA